MTIQDWGAIGELIGGFAVIVTLVYLALQVRQNTQSIKLSTSHAVTEEYRSYFELLAGNRGLCELSTRAANNEELRGVDRTQYYVCNSNFFRAYENAFFQWRGNALNSAQWGGMKRMAIDYCHTPACEITGLIESTGTQASSRILSIQKYFLRQQKKVCLCLQGISSHVA